MLKRLMTTFISLLVCANPGLALQARAQDQLTPLTFVVVIDISGSMDDRFPAPVQPVLTDSTKLMDVKRRLSLLVDHLPDNTRVLVTAFDHESQRLCDIRLDSAEACRKLQQTFASIKGRGGSTSLWRTADAELGRATQLAGENPETRVRVLLYTDGNDSENAPGLDHATLIRKYGKSLQSAVRLDWVTIGFDVQADIKRALQATGVTFTRADTPSDIDPLVAGFTIGNESPRVGDRI